MAATNMVAERPVRCTCTHLHSAHTPKGCEHCKCKAYRADTTPEVLRQVGVSSGGWHMRPNRQLEVQMMSREDDKTRVYNLLLLHSTPSHRKGCHELETEEEGSGTKRRNVGRVAVVETGGVFRPLQNADILEALNASQYDPLRRMTENWLKQILRMLEQERKIRRGGRPVRGQRTIHVYARPSLRLTEKKMGSSHTPIFPATQTKEKDLRVTLSEAVNSFSSATVKSLFRVADKIATDESITPKLREVIQHKVEDLKRFAGQIEEELLALLSTEAEEVTPEQPPIEITVPLDPLRLHFPGESISDQTLNNLHAHLATEYADVYTPDVLISAVQERRQAGPIRFGLLLRWEAGYFIHDLFSRRRREMAEHKEQEEDRSRATSELSTRLAIENAHLDYIRDAVTAAIEAMPPGEWQRRINKIRLEFAQHRAAEWERWTEDVRRQYAEAEARQTVRQSLRLMTLGEFSATERKAS